jgi:hypothetical protein
LHYPLAGSITGSVVAVGLILLVVGAMSLMSREPTGYDEADEEDDGVEDEEWDEDDPVDGGDGGLHPGRT